MNTIALMRMNSTPKDVTLSKRYHVRSSFKGTTYFTADVLENANLCRDRMQTMSDHYHEPVTWYVVDTYA